MILKQLLNGRQPSDFIVIKDNLNISAKMILKLFINSNLNLGNNVIFFMYEESQYDFNNEFLSNKNFTAYNCFNDPCNWLEKNESNKFEYVISNMTALKDNSVNVIIIDSLIYLLLNSNLHLFCETLKAVFDKNTDTSRNQIITTLHMHLLQDKSVELKQIECLAKSVITLIHDNKSDLNLALAEHRKPSGKIITEKYIVNLDSQGTFTYEILKNKPKEPILKETSPMDLTTFKLSLEDHERESRSRVVLPYVKTEESGRIFYVPDANDDWDEEDPDDDLEI